MPKTLHYRQIAMQTKTHKPDLQTLNVIRYYSPHASAYSSIGFCSTSRSNCTLACTSFISTISEGVCR